MLCFFSTDTNRSFWSYFLFKAPIVLGRKNFPMMKILVIWKELGRSLLSKQGSLFQRMKRLRNPFWFLCHAPSPVETWHFWGIFLQYLSLNLPRFPSSKSFQVALCLPLQRTLFWFLSITYEKFLINFDLKCVECLKILQKSPLFCRGIELCSPLLYLGLYHVNPCYAGFYLWRFCLNYCFSYYNMILIIERTWSI